MLAGPVRMASATCVTGMCRNDGENVLLASASPMPSIVWHDAQLSANSAAPSETLALDRFTFGIAGNAGESELIHAAIARDWSWVSRGVRRIASTARGFAAGMRP